MMRVWRNERAVDVAQSDVLEAMMRCSRIPRKNRSAMKSILDYVMLSVRGRTSPALVRIGKHLKP
jgi:hypothetical protein